MAAVLASAVTSARAVMLVALVRRAAHAMMRAVVAVLASAQSMKTVVRVWAMPLSAPSAKPLRTHSKP